MWRYAYEIKKDPTCNMVSTHGFMHALILVKRLRPNSLIHMAPVCSSWTWMNRGTNKRSRESPLGDTRLQYIREANVMVARCVMLALLAASLGHLFMVEQPSSLVMDAHPAFKFLLQLATHGVTRCVEIKTSMGMFGAETPKPTKLWGNPVWLPELSRRYVRAKAPTLVATAERYQDRNGVSRVKGAADLKGTQ